MLHSGAAPVTPCTTRGMPCHVRHVAGLKPGDTLYMLNIGYGSVKKMAQEAAAAVAGHGAGTVPQSPAAAGAGVDAEAGEAAGGLNVVYGEVKFPIRCVRAVNSAAGLGVECHVQRSAVLCLDCHAQYSAALLCAALTA